MSALFSLWLAQYGKRGIALLMLTKLAAGYWSLIRYPVAGAFAALLVGISPGIGHLNGYVLSLWLPTGTDPLLFQVAAGSVLGSLKSLYSVVHGNKHS